MKRRDFVTSVLVGGLATPVIGSPRRGGNNEQEQSEHGQDHGVPDGRLANHTLTFGHWSPTPDYPADPLELNTANPQPIDRFAPNDPFPRRLNGHRLTPSPLKIHVGDSVAFLISGFHLVLIYGPDIQPDDIDRTKLLISPPNTFPPIIDDPDSRLYRGLDPRTMPGTQDRVEVVGFNTRGSYLAICGVLPHFFEAATATTPARFVMFGYIEVRGDD